MRPTYKEKLHPANDQAPELFSLTITDDAGATFTTNTTSSEQHRSNVHDAKRGGCIRVAAKVFFVKTHKDEQGNMQYRKTLNVWMRTSGVYARLTPVPM